MLWGGICYTAFIMRNQYHPIAKLLHWSIVLLVGAQYLNADWMPEINDSVAPGFFFDVHASLGLLAGLLMIALFVMHFLSPVNKPEMSSPGMQERLALLAHLGLYALLLVTPLSGWASANVGGLSVNFFNMVDLPSLVALGAIELVGEGHELFTSALGFLVIIHILAAFYHHFFLEDNILNRMRPFVKVK